MDFFDKMGIFFTLAIFIVLWVAAICVYDILYKYPTAAQKANIHCKSIGFDQHKSFTRIGFLSETPVAIKCEYAEKYTDLGVRTSIS